MQSGPPPSRYRVIERGRRLEVIDTRADASVKPVLPPPTAAPTAASAGGRWPTLAERTGFDGRAVLVTHRWYDTRAPRRLLIDGGTAEQIGAARGVAVAAATVALVLAVSAPAALAVLLLPFALLHGPLRERLRTAATGWLDRFDPAPDR